MEEGDGNMCVEIWSEENRETGSKSVCLHVWFRRRERKGEKGREKGPKREDADADRHKKQQNQEENTNKADPFSSCS